MLRAILLASPFTLAPCQSSAKPWPLARETNDHDSVTRATFVWPPRIESRVSIPCREGDVHESVLGVVSRADERPRADEECHAGASQSRDGSVDGLGKAAR